MFVPATAVAATALKEVVGAFATTDTEAAAANLCALERTKSAVVMGFALGGPAHARANAFLPGRRAVSSAHVEATRWFAQGMASVTKVRVALVDAHVTRDTVAPSAKPLVKLHQAFLAMLGVAAATTDVVPASRMRIEGFGMATTARAASTGSVGRTALAYAPATQPRVSRVATTGSALATVFASAIAPYPKGIGPVLTAGNVFQVGTGRTATENVPEVPARLALVTECAVTVASEAELANATSHGLVATTAPGANQAPTAPPVKRSAQRTPLVEYAAPMATATMESTGRVCVCAAATMP